MQFDKTVVIIAGPTSVGKTAVAVDVANFFDTEIISADSRQCFKELNIGVARPSPETLLAVPHHFIASHAVHQQVNAAYFEQFALQKVAAIFRKNDVAIMVGGTGLYIKAFASGLDKIPQVPAAIHNRVIASFQAEGLPWLQQQVKLLDPRFFDIAEVQNPQRLMRALEVVLSTGKSILHFRSGATVQRPFNIIKIVLNLSRENLHHNINKRVDEMMDAGLEQEVIGLAPFKHLNALQTVGYKEMFEYFDGKKSLSEAVAAIKTNTRHYAKRQLTWFKKDEGFLWLPPSASQVLDVIKTRMEM